MTVYGLPVENTGAVITVGTFDGVHRGHFDVLTKLVNRATSVGLPSVVVTFDPHPLEIVNPDAAPLLLTTFREKLEILAQSGVSYVAVLPFTPSLASMEAEEFVDSGLLERFAMRELLVGYDHGFGRGRLGDTDVLRALGRSRGFGVTVLEPVSAADGRAVSSTGIRRAIAGGDLTRAAEGLGRLYSVSGTVGRGDQRGRQLGFPTLNLVGVPVKKMLPPDGVYAVRVQTPQGEFGGMLNLGPRPTFGDASRRIEAHVFDAAHDWYHAPVRLDFVARLRATQSFENVAQLVTQLRLDEIMAREALSEPQARSAATESP
jgi:riboflavin kinase/FMN adenylyltransferase